MSAQRFRKKPVVIEAMQFDGSDKSAEEIISWAGAGAVENETSNITFNRITRTLTIPTLEGDHTAYRWDFVIKGVASEFYPCKPDIFQKTYDPA